MSVQGIENKSKKRQEFGQVSTMLNSFMQSQFQSIVNRFDHLKAVHTKTGAKFQGLGPIQNASLENTKSLDEIRQLNPLPMKTKISAMNQTTDTSSMVHESESSSSLKSAGTMMAKLGDGKFQDIVQRASQKYNVPVALINAVIKQESNFNPQAVSPVGAQGLMQLMPATGRGYGVTNAFDPEQNIMAGTHFLSDLMKRYDGDVTLSLAGYNAGPGNVAKYGNQVPPFKETQNYVQRVGSFYKANLAQVDQSSRNLQNYNKA